MLGAVLGLVAVGKHALQGGSLMGPGWAAVVSGLSVVYISRAAAKRSPLAPRLSEPPSV